MNSNFLPGFALGMRHRTDPGHLTTIDGRNERSIRSPGVLWSLEQLQRIILAVKPSDWQRAMQKSRLPKVAVIGGSIAGLSTGVALRCLGCDVQIYEQSHTMLRGRGGGLVVQYEMLDWMTAHGIAALATLSIPGVERQFLDRDGRVIQRFPDSTPFTSWDAVFHQLRTVFPDDAYHHGQQCIGVSSVDGRCVAEFASGVHAEGDFIVGADGVGSVIRSHLFPDSNPAYAGYVAWRGVFPETLAPAAVIETLAQRFTLFQGNDFHFAELPYTRRTRRAGSRVTEA